jgi:uncharacterized protein YodC (DUF2158 family)
MESLQPDDVVQLKSGGPDMTVFNSDDLYKIYCQWFSGGELLKEHFRSDALVKVEDKDQAIIIKDHTILVAGSPEHKAYLKNPEGNPIIVDSQRLKESLERQG